MAESSKEAIDMFYSKLQTVLNSANRGRHVVTIGDFNAKLGKGSGIRGGVVGEFGLGERNQRGDMLIDCQGF